MYRALIGLTLALIALACQGPVAYADWTSPSMVGTGQATTTYLVGSLVNRPIILMPTKSACCNCGNGSGGSTDTPTTPDGSDPQNSYTLNGSDLASSLGTSTGSGSGSSEVIQVPAGNNPFENQVPIVPTPEPSSLLLILIVGGVLLFAIGRDRRSRSKAA